MPPGTVLPPVPEKVNVPVPVMVGNGACVIVPVTVAVKVKVAGLFAVGAEVARATVGAFF